MEVSKPISNPFKDYEGYNCFGCCPSNEHGLKMNFTDNGDHISASWEPMQYFQGYKNVLHGGIQTTLMDEIASWTVYTKIGTAGVTSKIEVKFLKPVYINQGLIIVKSYVKKVEKKSAQLEVFLYNSKNDICAEAIIEYFVYSKEVARKKLYFPGTDNFYKSI